MPGKHSIQFDTMLINPYRFSGLTDPGTANLLAHWPLQEFSAGTSAVTRANADNPGTYDLTDIGTTPSATGQVGNCADFTAANNEYLSGTFSNIHASDFSVSFWWAASGTKSTLSSGLVGQWGSAETNKLWSALWDFTTEKVTFRVRDGVVPANYDSTSNAVASTAFAHYVGVRSGNTLTLYVDGVAQSTTATFSGTENSGTTSLEVGRLLEDNARTIHGKIDEIRIYDKALTQPEISFLHTYPSGVAPATELTDGDLLAWWAMEEASNATRTDETGNYDLTNNGTVAQVTGKVGSYAADFDGSTDWLSNTSMGDIHTAAAGGFTATAWVKLSSLLGTPQGIMGQWNNTGTTGEKHWALYHLNTDNKFVFLKGTDPTNYSVKSDNAFTIDGLYHMVTGTYDGSTLRIYVDGVLQTGTSSPTGTENTTAEPLTVGKYEGTSRLLDGVIDEAAIFTRALTPAEILWLYNDGNGRAHSALTDVPNANDLVAYWPLQEYSDGTGAVTRADASGHGYDLTDASPYAPSATGQVGNCADFTAANSEYLSIADASWSTHNTSTSWSFWVNPKDAAPLSGAQVLLSKYNTSNQRSWSIYYPIAGNIRINISELGTAADVSLNGTEILTDNTWTHVCCVYDAGSSVRIYINGVLDEEDTTSIPASFFNSNADLIVGNHSGASFYFNGLIDEVRIYNYALSQEEITFLHTYPSGVKPVTPTNNDVVAWWGLDDLNDDDTDTAYNLTDGGTITYVSGKVGNAADFDGSTDYLSNAAFPDDIHQSDFTVGAWVKLTTAANSVPIMGKYGGTTATNHWTLFYDQTIDKWELVMRNAAGTRIDARMDGITTDTTNWHFVVGRRSGNDITCWFDGIEGTSDSDTFTGTEVGDATDLQIGRITTSTYLNGKVDEAFVFSRALTRAEILWLYNDGNGRAYADL